jgi:hypothetical protein
MSADVVNIAEARAARRARRALVVVVLGLALWLLRDREGAAA